MKKRLISLILCIVLMVPALPAAEADAADKPSFQIQQARKLALAKSSEYMKLYNELDLLNIKLESAYTTVAAKWHNLRSFRWTPLLSFKFPQNPDMAEEFEFSIKPQRVQSDINAKRHELADVKYGICNNVNKLYLEIYMLQEEIAFYEKTIDTAQKELAQNQIRLLNGSAKQADVDNMASSLEKMKSAQAQKSREILSKKEELGEMVGIDLRIRYVFKNPLKKVDIPRSDLETIVQYTVDSDQNLYSLKMTSALLLNEFEYYEQLYRGHYGGKVDAINSFLTGVKNGNEVDYAAFKKAYKSMLKDFDSPWDGKFQILYLRLFRIYLISFTKEWLKGSLSGTRYIEDDQYALYTAAKEYGAARKEAENEEKSLRKTVEKEYESLITLRNVYEAAASDVKQQKAKLDQLLLLNVAGKADYTEVKSKRDDYQAAQMDEATALSDYNIALYAYEDLTCGAITKYMQDAGIGSDAGGTGQSSTEDERVDKAYYYINSKVEDMMFEFTVSFPENYEPEVNQFELWIDGMLIGERKKIDEQLRHLTLSKGQIQSAVVKFFLDGDYVAECIIDETQLRGELNLPGGKVEKKLTTIMGNYAIMKDATTNTVKLSITPAEGEGIASYRLKAVNGMYVSSDEMIKADEKLTYLSLLVGDLSQLVIELYSSDGSKICDATFDTAELELVRITEE